jgi:hypothetical protein
LACDEKNDRVAAFGSAVNAYLPPSTRRRFRIAGLIAAVVCVLAIAAGAFAVSYPGVRDMALTAGVAAHYARFYPWIFDAVFVVAAVAALSLRGALRAYAWLAILVILGAVAAADAIHAMSVVLPKRPTEATVAAAPWAVLLIGFTLLYAMSRRGAAISPTPNGGPDDSGQPTHVPLSALLADKPATRPERALTAQAATATVTKPHPPARTEPLTTKPEPAAPKKELAAPKAESAISTAESIPPKTEPVTTMTEPAAPETELVATKAEPLITKTGPTASRTEPATLKTDPVSTKPATAEPVASPADPYPADPYPAGTQPFAAQHPPIAIRPFTEPGFPARQPAERDDPSDADAEPMEPAAHFNRLRSSPMPPGED